jgi:hypothetical protein
MIDESLTPAFINHPIKNAVVRFTILIARLKETAELWREIVRSTVNLRSRRIKMKTGIK